MQPDDVTRLIEAIAKLISALAWPAVLIFALLLLRPSVREFLATLSEVRLKGAGFEASAQRRLNLDATRQRLHDFWKPDGKVNRANVTRITTRMRQLGIGGSVAWLINAGTADDRSRVVSCLSLQD
ncbi:MAG TPA: hypothetical protein VND19_02695 [Acetobacteraceae bacterium]|nr:hypothetical protein [Acetobacteraceae bacterium]